MANYSYECLNCTIVFDIVQSFSEAKLTNCTECGGVDSLRRILFPPTILDTTPKTVGGLADRNEEKGGKYWVEDKHRQIAERNKMAGKAIGGETYERPWWRDTDTIDTSLTTI